MKFNGSSGVQVRMPSNLQDLAAYTSLKFYIQNPEPRSRQRRQDGAEEGRFVLYLGSREVRRGRAGRGRAVGAHVGGSHLDVSPIALHLLPECLWGARTGPGCGHQPGWRWMGTPVRIGVLGQWDHQGEHCLVLLPVLNAKVWPCLSLHSGHRRLPGHRAQGPQSALGLQTGR